MRFILFNIAVAVSIIYLIKGDDLQIANMKAQLQQAKSNLIRLTKSEITRDEMFLKQKVATVNKSPTVDTGDIGTGKDNEPVARKKEQQQVKPKSNSSDGTDNTVENIARQPSSKDLTSAGHSQDLTKNILSNPSSADKVETAKFPISAEKRLPASDGVAQRRAEVLAENGAGMLIPNSPISLKPGATLMNARERKFELESLVEEMELLFVKKVGS